MKLIWLKGKGMVPFVVLMLFFTSSCTDGYKDDWEWSSSVKNTTLTSPETDGITVRFSADGTTQTISWEVVPGAGGYQVSVYNIDDPEHPVLIGEENEFVDGTSVTRPSTDDTRYKVVIKSLGNAKFNNTESATATEKLYNNMLAVYAYIPNNTNLTEYFTANPIPDTTAELCYELEAGGNYTMTGNISQDTTPVTFRSGDRFNHAKITVTDGSFVNGGTGLKLRFIDMDYSGFTGAASNAVIQMSSNFPTTGLTESLYFVVPTTSPIVLQSCKITGLRYYLFYDNSTTANPTKYAIGTLLIKDCIIGRSANQSAAEIRFAAGMLKDLTITNSTIYSEVADGSSRFIQISTPGKVSDVKPTTETWANGSMTITHCTFYQSDKTSQSFNSNGAMRQQGDKVTIQYCVFVNSFNQEAIRRFRSSNNTPTFTGGYNSYWFNGVFPTNEETHAQGDNSGTIIKTDPQLTYLGNGEFTMTGTDQIAARTGDPRWLPAE
jgi:hypothetical protein